MRKITVPTADPYEVWIGSGLLGEAGPRAAALTEGRTALLLSDSGVWPLYGKTVAESLKKTGFRVEPFVFPMGEKSKSPDTLLELLTFMSQRELTRSDVLFALGGGVTGDLGGLAAALYLRGIPCVELPTSLLAMVDSSVGGKTAVNLPQGKNLVGTFTQPKLVLCDPDALKTLPQDMLAEGWAEVIKYGMLGSRELLSLLRKGPEQNDTEQIIALCVEMKRDLAAADERDLGKRQILNFGHTIGHAAECCSGLDIRHGAGVAMGMAVMTRACVRLGRCPAACWDILEELLDIYCLPKTCPMGAEELLKAARADKKRRGEEITLVLPEKIGHCILRRTNYDELALLLERGLAL